MGSVPPIASGFADYGYRSNERDMAYAAFIVSCHKLISSARLEMSFTRSAGTPPPRATVLISFFRAYSRYGS